MCSRGEIEISVASSSHLYKLLEAVQGDVGNNLLRSQKELLSRISQSTGVKLCELPELSDALTTIAGNDDNRLICTLLRGCKLTFSSPNTNSSSFAPISYDMEERRAYLRRRQEEREYAQFVDNKVDFSENSKSITTRESISEIKGQISVIANMFVCAFAMFGVGYYVGVQYKCDMQTRMIFGLVGAVFMMFIEMVLYIIRTHNASVATYHSGYTKQQHSTQLQTVVKPSKSTKTTREDQGLDDLYDTVISIPDVQLDVKKGEHEN